MGYAFGSTTMNQISRNEQKKYVMTVEDGADILSRKAGNQLPMYTARRLRRVISSTVSRYEGEISQ
jgi:cobalamin biosynthesis protein CobT